MNGANLAALLPCIRPRETAGSRTAGRYGYQTNVGILKLIELVDAGQDFCLVFDYFDDLAVLDHPQTPRTIHLYQVKTKDTGEWSMTALCKFEGKVKPRSFMARMYAHLETFGPFLGETGFVSNAPYTIDMANGGVSSGARHRIASADMHKTELAKATTAIEKEFTPATVGSWLPKLVLIRAPLGVHNHEATIKGFLNDYLEKIGSAGDLSLSAIYQALHANIAGKTGFAQEGLPYRELIARKSLTRGEFEELIQRAAERHRGILASWDTIERDLEKEGSGSAQIIRLKTYAARYQQQRNSRHPQAQMFRLKAEAWIATNIKIVETCATITGLATAMQKDLDELSGYTEQQAYAALIVEAHEAIHATA